MASGESQRGVGAAQAQERQCEGEGRREGQGHPRDLPHTTALHEGKTHAARALGVTYFRVPQMLDGHIL